MRLTHALNVHREFVTHGQFWGELHVGAIVRPLQHHSQAVHSREEMSVEAPIESCIRSADPRVSLGDDAFAVLRAGR